MSDDPYDLEEAENKVARRDPRGDQGMRVLEAPTDETWVE